MLIDDIGPINKNRKSNPSKFSIVTGSSIVYVTQAESNANLSNTFRASVEAFVFHFVKHDGTSHYRFDLICHKQ